MKTGRREGFQAWHTIVLGIVSVMVISGLVSCSWFEDERRESPTTPEGSAVELGNYAQQAGQSRVVTVNGAQHQINGVISGSVVAGGLYIEINEQSSVGSPVGTDQVMVHLQDVTITLTGLPSGVSAIQVSSNGAEIGQYAVSSGSVVIALSWAQWTQWFGTTHYAVVCVAVGEGRVEESMAAVSGRLPSGEVVTFGKGFAPECPEPTVVTSGGTSCPSGGTCDPNALPTFQDNSDGTITDTRTGLMWLQDGDCLGDGTWNQTSPTVQERVADLNAGTSAATCANYTATYTDWRLPTVKELASLMNYSRPDIEAWLRTQGFTDVQDAEYWTSTEYAPNTTHAWYVLVGNGYVYAGDATRTYSAWAVRVR